MDSSRQPGASPRAVALTMVGWLGLAACLTLVFLGMRAVMDVGGACADGGPYVSAQSCPDGSAAALVLGTVLGMGFGFVASVGGLGVGGIWTATPVLAWAALFGSLGWNFMEYGVFDSPAGIEWGWAIPGVLFWLMAAGPLLVLGTVAEVLRSVSGPSARGSGRGSLPGVVDVRVMPGPGQPSRPAPRPVGPTRSVGTAGATAPQPSPPTAPPSAERETLAGLAADFGAVVDAAMAGTPADREPSFTEGTQALLDRLERLADMRDRGLLDPAEFETAKAAIMLELEGRS